MGQDRNMNYCELASPISCPGSLQCIGLCPVSVQLSWQQTIAHFTVRAFSGHRKVSLTALEPCHPDSSSRTILLLIMLSLSHSTALHCSSATSNRGPACHAQFRNPSMSSSL